MLLSYDTSAEGVYAVAPSCDVLGLSHNARLWGVCNRLQSRSLNSKKYHNIAGARIVQSTLFVLYGVSVLSVVLETYTAHILLIG